MRISDWSSDVCSSDLIDRLPAGAPVVRRQRLDTAAVEGDSRAELGDQQKDDIADAGGAERPGRPDMQDVDVALGQDVRERARPRSRRRVAGNAQAGRKVDYEKGDDDPVEQGGREVAPQPL